MPRRFTPAKRETADTVQYCKAMMRESAPIAARCNVRDLVMLRCGGWLLRLDRGRTQCRIRESLFDRHSLSDRAREQQ
jgi:hypothetical protein